MITVSEAFTPIMMKGLKVHPENPLQFDFLIDSGHSGLALQSDAFKAESDRLIRYFLASLTIPEKDLWVNLSPYEHDRMINAELGKTGLGRDMLAQDYILKQLTASLVYPEKELGKKFWDNVYTQAQAKFGTTDIPVDTFNKVWIKADKARVLERNGTAYVVGAHLKVMIESDYLAESMEHGAKSQQQNKINANPEKNSNNSLHPSMLSAPSSMLPAPGSMLARQILKSIIIPAIEEEVNTGANFAPLRQMFYAMILSTWYKATIKDALLNQVYADKGLTNGVISDDPAAKDKIYAQYLEAYTKGVFNYIKEDAAATGDLPRKYFSGGVATAISEVLDVDHTALPSDDLTVAGDMAQVTANMARALPRQDLPTAKNDPAQRYELILPLSQIEPATLIDTSMTALNGNRVKVERRSNSLMINSRHLLNIATSDLVAIFGPILIVIQSSENKHILRATIFPDAEHSHTFQPRHLAHAAVRGSFTSQIIALNAPRLDTDGNLSLNPKQSLSLRTLVRKFAALERFRHGGDIIRLQDFLSSAEKDQALPVILSNGLIPEMESAQETRRARERYPAALLAQAAAPGTLFEAVAAGADILILSAIPSSEEVLAARVQAFRMEREIIIIAALTDKPFDLHTDGSRAMTNGADGILVDLSGQKARMLHSLAGVRRFLTEPLVILTGGLNHSNRPDLADTALLKPHTLAELKALISWAGKSSLPMTLTTDSRPDEGRDPAMTGRLPWETDEFRRILDATSQAGHPVHWVGASTSMLEAGRQVLEAAREKTAPILITGLPNTGRESAWQAIHAMSPRNERKPVVIDARRLNTYLEDDLRERFLGLDGEPGFLERAQGSTLIINNIDQVSSLLSRSLIELLKSRSLKRADNSADIDLTGIQFIATSSSINRPYSFEARQVIDLFGSHINIPPLAERREDRPLLFEFYSYSLAQEQGKTWRPLSLDAGFLLANDLSNYPGQIEDLKDLVTRVLDAPQGTAKPYVTPDDLIDARMPLAAIAWSEDTIMTDANGVPVIFRGNHTEKRPSVQAEPYLDIVHGQRPYFDAIRAPGLFPVQAERTPPADAERTVQALNTWLADPQNLARLGIRKASRPNDTRAHAVEQLSLTLGPTTTNGEYEIILSFLLSNGITTTDTLVTALPQGRRSLWVALLAWLSRRTTYIDPFNDSDELQSESIKRSILERLQVGIGFSRWPAIMIEKRELTLLSDIPASSTEQSAGQHSLDNKRISLQNVVRFNGQVPKVAAMLGLDGRFSDTSHVLYYLTSSSSEGSDREEAVEALMFVPLTEDGDWLILEENSVIQSLYDTRQTRFGQLIQSLREGPLQALPASTAVRIQQVPGLKSTLDTASTGFVETTIHMYNGSFVERLSAHFDLVAQEMNDPAMSTNKEKILDLRAINHQVETNYGPARYSNPSVLIKTRNMTGDALTPLKALWERLHALAERFPDILDVPDFEEWHLTIAARKKAQDGEDMSPERLRAPLPAGELAAYIAEAKNYLGDRPPAFVSALPLTGELYLTPMGTLYWELHAHNDLVRWINARREGFVQNPAWNVGTPPQFARVSMSLLRIKQKDVPQTTLDEIERSIRGIIATHAVQGTLRTPAGLQFENLEVGQGNYINWKMDSTESVPLHTDEAQSSVRNPGGIDLNAENMALDVKQDGEALNIEFDQTLIEQFRQENFSGVVPVILKITPIKNIF
jgi:hypothetical protein